MVGGHPWVNVLGPITAESDAGPIALGGRMQRAVLAALVLHYPAAVSAPRLIDHLWLDDPPTTAQGTVYAYISRLRKALGPDVVVKHDDGYRLSMDPTAIDAGRFASEVAAAHELAAAGDHDAAAKSYRAALELWRGDPYGELGYEEFLRAEQAHLLELRATTLEAYFAERLEASDQDPLLAAEIEAALVDHPFREQLWHQLMSTLYRQGRQADALRAYRRAERSLGEELGIEPGHALRALEEQILLQEPGLLDRVSDEDRRAHPVVPSNLRPTVTSFIGREDLMEQTVAATLAHRVVTLLGPGGVGKTRLAIETGWAVAERMPHGVWEVDLLPEIDPGAVARRLAEAMQLPDRPGDPVTHIARRLEGRPALIILDNCEHLNDLADMIDELVRRIPEVTVLATSRQPTDASGEQLIHVPPLATAGPDESPESTLESPAARLFQDRVRLARKGYRATSTAAAATGRIVRKLDGLPLAVEIAAAQASIFTVAEIADQLDAGSAPSMARPSDDPRHETLTALIDWSYALLEPDDRRRVVELAVFADSLSVDSAARLWDDHDRGNVEQALTALASKSLLVEAPPTGGGSNRYRMLETIREYGRQRLEAAGSWDTVINRYTGLIEDLVTTAANHFHDGTQLSWIRQLRQERAEISQALRFVADDRDRLVTFASCLWYWWYLDGNRDEALNLLTAVIDADGPASLVAAHCLINAEHGNTPPAEIASEAATAIRLAESAGAEERALTLLLAGDALTAVAHYRDAEGPLLEAEERFQQLGCDWGVGWAQLRRVRVEGLGRGDDRGARTVLASAVDHLEAAGDAALLGYARIIQASMARLHGRWGDSLEHGLLAVATFKDLGMKMRESEAAFYPPLAYVNLGRVAEARQAIDQLRLLAHQLGDDASLFAAALVEADLEKRHGDVDTAVVIYEDLLASAEQDHDGWNIARVLLDLSDGYRVAGDIPAAEQAVTRGRPMWDDLEQPWLRAQFDVVAAEVALAAQQFDAAEGMLVEAIASNQTLGQFHMLARAYEGSAILNRFHGEGSSAVRHLAIATAIREHIGAPLDPRRRQTHRELSAWGLDRLGPDQFRKEWAGAAESVGQLLDA